MAWDISISAEGWDDIYNELENWSKEDLVEAVALAKGCDMKRRKKEKLESYNDKYDKLENYLLWDITPEEGEEEYKKTIKEIKSLKKEIKNIEKFLDPEHQHFFDGFVKSQKELLSKDIIAHSVLVNEAYEWIAHNNTCDNGGYKYWIDAEGWNKVELKDEPENTPR